MTVRESYEKIGSNFDEVLRRLGSEALVKRFALKFLNDTSFQDLKDALVKKDGETAFRAAHTLKGVCLNLGFDRLYEVSAELTEKLKQYGESLPEGVKALLGVLAFVLFLILSVARW